MVHKKVLILGAVQGEVPLVEAFQELGYYVIVAGKGSNYPCCSIADKFYDVDIMNYELILKIAKEENVSAVTSNVVERAIRVVAYVTEKLGLESIGYEIAQIFTNKYKMRQAAEKAGVGVPKYTEVSNVEQALDFAKSCKYPLIIKPVDNGGSKGIQKVESDEQLVCYFNESLKMSVSDASVIIEQFIEGEEYIVDAFTHNYTCDNTDLSTKRKFNLSKNFVSKAVIIQDADSCDTKVEKALLETNKKLVEGIGLRFGITHGEYIYNQKEDKVYLVEITARGGGVYLASHLTPLATGINVNKLLALYSLGYDVLGEKHLKLKKGSAAWYAFALPEGEIVSVEGIVQAKTIPGVYDIIDSSFYVGKKVKELVDDSGKFGPIIISAETRDKCDEVFGEVQEVLKIGVKTADGLRGIIW